MVQWGDSIIFAASMSRRGEREIFDRGKRLSTFVVEQHIGGGGYGECYSVKDTSDGTFWAMKVELKNKKNHLLEREAKIMYLLQNSAYFPKYRSGGITGGFHYIAMELLGPSLTAVRKHLYKHKFSAYSYLKLGLEMLNAIHEFHRRGFVHRDIKPANFLVKPDREVPIVLIDYGLAMRYLTESGRHISFRKGRGFTGTTRYASFNAHKGYELSRRDDLISWFYSVLEMATGSCPWPGRRDKEETARIKEGLIAESICEGLPVEFNGIYKHIMNLQFHEKPDYAYITKQILKAMEKGEFDTTRFDWETFPESTVKKISAISLKMNGEETVYATGKCCNVC